MGELGNGGEVSILTTGMTDLFIVIAIYFDVITFVGFEMCSHSHICRAPLYSTQYVSLMDSPRL